MLKEALAFYTITYNTAFPSGTYLPFVTPTDIYAFAVVGGGTSSSQLQVVTFTGGKCKR